jgi:serine/threonine-protein kinase
LRRALDTEELRTRFEREARATAQLSSPHVVRVLDAGAFADGSPYMVMEHLAGRDLARVLREDGRLSVTEAVDCMLQVCEVLREAHGRGVVHRDLKPANLILGRSARGGVDVKVLDFGISKIVASATDADNYQDVTVPFTMLGSPRYMAPEQVRNSKDVDGRADLWSVGAVRFQLITGEHVFAAVGAVQASVAVLTAEPRDLQDFAPHAPLGLAEVVRRCLTKDVAERWQSAGDLIAALQPFGSP